MDAILGVVFHWIGGLSSGSFYVPYKGVKKWSWETYWLVGGVFSWIICPWILASIMTNHLGWVLGHQQLSTLFWTYFFGAMWGLGGLTFGLTMRYLGMSLGMGVALGYCAAFGTLMPPIFKVFMPNLKDVPQSIIQIAQSGPGLITLAGVLVCLIGIGIAAMAGLTKEREMPLEEKKKAIGEFDFKKGILVATFSGIMSAGMSFAMTAGTPIGDTSVAVGTNDIWSGLPKLVVVLLGGFTSNFLWCLYLNIKNKSGHEYISGRVTQPVGRDKETIIETVTDAPGEETAVRANRASAAVANGTSDRVPMLSNYIFSAMAGTLWYFQFFFYTMGETKMKKADLGFSSWTLHMASIIIFSTLWGFYFLEWKGASKKARQLIVAGIATLVLSTIIIGGGAGYQAYLDKHPSQAAAAPAK